MGTQGQMILLNRTVFMSILNVLVNIQPKFKLVQNLILRPDSELFSMF